MKRYSDTPINVRLGRYQENKLNEMIKNENYCQQRGIFSKVDAVRTGLNNVIKDIVLIVFCEVYGMWGLNIKIQYNRIPYN